MPIFGDYHTHTVYSHGSGTVKDNVNAAIEAGLHAVAITDHGFRHLLYCVPRRQFPHARADVEEEKRLHPEMQILLGLETNIQGYDGTVDLLEEDLDRLDLIVCGYHRMAFASSVKNFCGFGLSNFWSGLTGFTSKRHRIKNTDAFINAMNRYPIDILSHPLHRISFDLAAVAKEAARLGTYLELNGKHQSMTDDQIRIVLDAGAMLIVDSDAHSPERVGEAKGCFDAIERIGIPSDRIANFDRAPLFRSQIAKDKRAATPEG